MDHATQPKPDSGTLPGGDGADAVDWTGKTLGDYRILRRLGQGGMGQVYLAEQISLKRKVALKLLRPDLAANSVSLQRFRAEALAVAQATHANIVQVYFISPEKDEPHYMALEYVEGRNLREYLEKKGPPELLIALSIMRQVAAALQRASELGILHRDIKPENILVTKKGEVKVADFGLSRVFSENGPPPSLTQSGVTMGTPLYMSPEQVEGKKTIDFRSDIYSFGVTCYHLLAGQPPFRGETALEVAYQQVHKEPTPLNDVRPDLPADLCALVHKMMAKNPDERIQTGREIVRELVRLRDQVVGVTGAVGTPGFSSGFHLTGAAIGLGPVPPQPSDAYSTQRLRTRARSRRLLWLALVSIFLALGGGLLAGWLHNRGERDVEASIVNPNPDTGDPALLRETELKKKYDESKSLKVSIQLGTFYLSEHALLKAEEFFKGLEKDGTDPKLRTLGNLGHAMVLSHQDHAKTSNLLFMAVLLGKKTDAKDGMRDLADLKKDLKKNELKTLLEYPEIADALVVAQHEIVLKMNPKKSCFYFMLSNLSKQNKKLEAKEKFFRTPPEDLSLKGITDKNPTLKTLLEDAVLRQAIAAALDRNQANFHYPELLYPHVLKKLREPWSPS